IFVAIQDLGLKLEPRRVPSKSSSLTARTNHFRIKSSEIRIRSADELQVQAVRILHEHIADRIAPLDERLVLREDAAAAGLDLSQDVADVADADGHAARHRVGDSQVERLAWHALDLDELDARRAARDHAA